ncbi:MAG: membrane-bound lytic murein transglycosylase MltF [Rhodocyclaceae bacterium]|nr:membrane-bound lytic murein transglycosylase MltF [Rhodocyclaceae bacterium]
MFNLLRSLYGLLLLCLLLVGCSRLDPPGPQQPLVVGLPADPVFQQLAPPSEGMNGIGRDLVDAFARRLGVEVRLVVAPDYATLLTLLREGKVHMIGALPVQGSDAALTYSQPLLETRQLIVQHASALPADSPEKLAGREISLLPGAPQVRTLSALKIEPPPLIVERSGVNELELLAGVARRRYDLVASDELHFDIAANFSPDLAIAFELPEKLAYAWAFPATSLALREEAAQFIESVKKDGTLRRLYDRYFGHIRRMDTRDIGVFLEHVRGRLPNYRQAFQEAQEITGIDWRLLAALAYQESKWDPLATSPTGVRGMMMLTEDTADRLGVGNRLDARESIRAGAKYLALLMDDLPEEIRQPDRLWFALAAYNLGMGHLKGGRRFAPGLKRDPNLWVDMKEVLPLLARPEYYERLKSGRARGGEAVILVENVRNFHDILVRFEPTRHSPPLQTGLAMQ